MKRFLFLLCITSVGLCASAQTPYDAFAPEALVNNNVDSRDVKPYSGEFFCRAAAPVKIQCPGFALMAGSGSLNKDITLSAAVIKREGGHAMPSEMERRFECDFFCRFMQFYRIYFCIFMQFGDKKVCNFLQY